MRHARVGTAPPGAGLARRLNWGVWGLGLLSGALIAGLLAWQAAREREALIERERESLLRMAQLVSVETKNMFARIRHFCETADLWLAENPGVDPRTDAAFQRLVAIFRSSVDGLIDIRLVSGEGGLFYIPSKPGTPLADVRDRDYYQAQLEPATRGFYIANPVKSRVTGLWGIPISYPLTPNRAGMAVIFAAIELPTLDKAYEPIRPKPGGSIALARKDGVLLARTPFIEEYAGKPLVASDPEAWWKGIEVSGKGTWSVNDPFGAPGERLIAYAAVEPFGLVATVGSPYRDFLAAWRASLLWRILLALAMLAAMALLTARLASTMRRLDAARAELGENLERLRRSDATKDKLFSVIAHDLRGPVGGMRNLLDTLAEDRAAMSGETLDECLDALRLASWNTYQLLDNLLAWSRSERGELRFEPRIEGLRPAVEECVELYALSIASKGISVRIEVDPSLELRADPELLKVVLRNLLSNAVKFTRKGGSVAISASRADGETRIEVRDDGIGMSKEELEGLFDLESTRSRSGTANERGSGLGLVLCREIVELHGGRIAASGEPGAGAAVTISLPDGPPEAPAPSDAA